MINDGDLTDVKDKRETRVHKDDDNVTALAELTSNMCYEVSTGNTNARVSNK